MAYENSYAFVEYMKSDDIHNIAYLRTVECTLIPIKSWIPKSQDKLEFVRMSVAKNKNTGVNRHFIHRGTTLT